MVDVTKIGGYFMPDKKERNKSGTSDGSFGNILDQAQKSQTSQVTETAPLRAPMPVQAGPDYQMMAAQQADKLLGLLEQYASALENPEATLKSMDSMVGQMELEAATAKRVLSHVDANEGVGKIVNQAAVYASVEAFKFRRGDYV
ncbi:hypothetical protein SAMN02745216_04666 [Desulfatibacillum alkenivorans DSM 16219]|jgi:hypothetical protein|uniref:Uncharacterized protein n=1 Tax=Desulfatibacillum alkenivorans DSM 16219 TaxID=1121393 RepID=A0A1M6Y4R0_9BACT|nr:hypothetical protein [Desulfatibacillum alkenivorans]SHL13270.1 hypothetical protein SAMN02745216_04666 [Desulfatibacillum alkenivorans DSM 16219]